MSQVIATSQVIDCLHAVEKVLPEAVRSSFGELTWTQRVHNVTVDSNKYKVHFYGDGLSLKEKTQVESIVKECVSHAFPELDNVTLYFERKEKKPKPESKPQQQKNPSSQKNPNSPFNRKKIPGVKRILAVASGKGGVGKSTVTVNLAMALYNQGYKVGILDADIYGPSIPTMLGVHEDPSVNEKKKIIPIESQGIKVMSFGFFAPDDSAIIWRGPMINRALQQFLFDVDWGDLDFLLLDLPPGTGDAQLTIVQSAPLSGAVIVTTPQNVALQDAAKGIQMFEKTDVPMAGLVENMSTFTCPECHTESHIFGQGGGDKISKRYQVPFLGHVPLIPEIREAGDTGTPLTAQSAHPVRIRFAEIAEKVVKNVVELEKKA